MLAPWFVFGQRANDGLRGSQSGPFASMASWPLWGLSAPSTTPGGRPAQCHICEELATSRGIALGGAQPGAK